MQYLWTPPKEVADMLAGTWHECPVCTDPSGIATKVQQNVPVAQHFSWSLITDACGSFFRRRIDIVGAADCRRSKRRDNARSELLHPDA